MTGVQVSDGVHVVCATKPCDAAALCSLCSLSFLLKCCLERAPSTVLHLPILWSGLGTRCTLQVRWPASTAPERLTWPTTTPATQATPKMYKHGWLRTCSFATRPRDQVHLAGAVASLHCTRQANLAGHHIGHPSHGVQLDVHLRTETPTGFCAQQPNIFSSPAGRLLKLSAAASPHQTPDLSAPVHSIL